MKTLSDLQAAAAEFCKRVNAECTLTDPVPVSALRKAGALRHQTWAASAGAYAILEGLNVRYVGRALKGNTLAGRLGEHLRARTGDICRALSHPGAQIVVFSLTNDDAWLAPSLELLLQARLRDAGFLNRKRS